MAAKAAFLRVGSAMWVCEGWMVEVVGLKLVTHHPVIEPLSAPAPGTEISYAETGSQNPTFRLTETDAETLWERESLHSRAINARRLAKV
jgi:hypothetical protein